MIHGPTALPEPVQILVNRAIALCEAILPHCRAVYPFAAIYESGKVGCLFTDEDLHGANERQLIEQLQWRIIDTTTDSDNYSILVYAATVNTDRSEQLDAIAITVTGPDDTETLLLYPYFRVGNKIVVSPPIHQ